MGKYLNWIRENILDKKETLSELRKDENKQEKMNENPKEEILDTIFISHMDDLFWKAGRIIIENNKASVAILQRIFEIDFNRAIRIMDELYEAGIVGEESGTRPREILINQEEFDKLECNGVIKVRRNGKAEKKEEKQKTYTIKDVENILRISFGINANYSNDGESLKRFKNFIVSSTPAENHAQIINTLLTHNSPITMRMVLIDDSAINYSSYNTIPHMLIPVVTNEGKFDVVMNWFCAETQNRINKFLECGAKNIDLFNQKMTESGKETIPKIVCIANEASSFFKSITMPLERLFLNSNMVGIYFILFSRFSLKSLEIGKTKELLENTDSDRLLSILSQSENSVNQHTLIRNFDNMGGHQFERFCADVLRENGFCNVEVTQGSGDHGIDILAEKDGITYAIQCKCYSSDIGNVAVQQAYTGKGFYNKDIAVVLTNRYFTPQAIEEANTLGVKLWNRNKLNEMIGTNKGNSTEKTYHINESFVIFSLKNGNKIEILSICNSDINAAKIFLSFSIRLKEEYAEKFDFTVAVEYKGKTAVSSKENGVEFFGGKEENGEFIAGIPKWMDMARDKLLNGDKMEFLEGIEKANKILGEFMEEVL